MYLIPEPQKLIMAAQNGKTDNFANRFYLHYDGKIVLDVCDSQEGLVSKHYEDAVLLQAEMERTLGFSQVITAGVSQKAEIYLKEGKDLSEDEYLLRISQKGVELIGGQGAGLFYGIQTLRQIIRQEGAALPYCEIEDRPDILNRGLYHDVTRGRIPTMDYLKKLADCMAFYKLNQLQLYIEHSFLFEGLSEMWRDDTPLTAQDILELDMYCRKLHIELVPSLSCFGHLYKLLRTKSYAKYCELVSFDEQAFSFTDRMAHHTINVSDEGSFQLITCLIDQYLPLFTSRKFNIGADETFDLGKGRSAGLAEEIGTQRLYVDFVKRLCTHLTQKGRQPMFWGDIIGEFPEAIKELPKETICLNWGYSATQSDDSIKKLAAVGARQYACPGVQGWNRFVNALGDAYDNISRMCAYAHEYNAEGVLTTDWGDCGHINHPEFGLPGIIYGAAFSWNKNRMSANEINHAISVLEYGDGTEEFVDIITEVGKTDIWNWWAVTAFLQGYDGRHTEYRPTPEQMKNASSDIEKLTKLQERICEKIVCLNGDKRHLLKPYLVAIEGMKLVQRLGMELTDIKCDEELASDLENWYMDFKEVWHLVSRESELYRVGEVIFGYADLLRERYPKL